MSLEEPQFNQYPDKKINSGGGMPQEPKQPENISSQVHPETSIQDDKQKETTLSDVTRKVAGAYDEQVANIGYIQPSRLASKLVPGVSSDHPKRQELKKVILRQPTKEHLYDGAEETLSR